MTGRLLQGGNEGIQGNKRNASRWSGNSYK